MFRGTADPRHRLLGNSRPEEMIGDAGVPHWDIAIKTLAFLGPESARAFGDERLGHTRLLIDSRSPVVPTGNSSSSARRVAATPKRGPVFRDRGSGISQLENWRQFTVQNW